MFIDFDVRGQHGMDFLVLLWIMEFQDLSRSNKVKVKAFWRHPFTAEDILGSKLCNVVNLSKSVQMKT